MAGTRKDLKLIRSQFLIVRFTAAEYKQFSDIVNKSDIRNKSEFVRRCVLREAAEGGAQGALVPLPQNSNQAVQGANGSGGRKPKVKVKAKTKTAMVVKKKAAKKAPGRAKRR